MDSQQWFSNRRAFNYDSERSSQNNTTNQFGGKEVHSNQGFRHTWNVSGSTTNEGRGFHQHNIIHLRKKPRLEECQNANIVFPGSQNIMHCGSNDLGFCKAVGFQASHPQLISGTKLTGVVSPHGMKMAPSPVYQERNPREICYPEPILSVYGKKRVEMGRCFPASSFSQPSSGVSNRNEPELEARNFNFYSFVYDSELQKVVSSSSSKQRGDLTARYDLQKNYVPIIPNIMNTTLDPQIIMSETVESDDWSLLSVVESAARHCSKSTRSHSASVNNEWTEWPNSTQQTGNARLDFEDILPFGEKKPEDHDTSTVKIDETFCSKGVYSGAMPRICEDPQIGFKAKEIKLVSNAEDRGIDQKLNSSGSKANNPTESSVNKTEERTFLTDFFTAEQIRVHLQSLNPSNLSIGMEVDPGKSTSFNTFDIENTCQLCEMKTLKLTPLPLSCASCAEFIKLNSNFYWAKNETETRRCFCMNCFRGSHTNIRFKGVSIPKKTLQKGKNIEEDEEAWVKCDKCERWQHQICALYNQKMDYGGTAKYICPLCRLAKMASEQNASSIPKEIGAAQDLPRTFLSDHIEERLFRSLQRERKQRADLSGKSYEEVAGASDLTVRVVLSVQKVVKVSPKFSSILHDEDYPSEFPYTSKAILLFQKVEGVDVCLFALYVQEFGSECGQPNTRCVYISYLDSVKYFTPEVKTTAGEALRTFVYHEILVGYLDYCKQRGFSTCYIWSCAPVKGDDYILYSHPESQKLPKNDKLRQWYKSFLRKAEEAKVVTEYTNFYNHFFIPNGNKNQKISAARLPYFDGDFWSGAVEDIVRSLEEAGEGKSESTARNSVTSRNCDLSVGPRKDIQVMQKLGSRIKASKEDFIIVHLQFTCKNCRQAIVARNRWSCQKCSNFHMCSRCHELKQVPGEVAVLEKHRTSCGEDDLCQFTRNGLPDDTDDRDVSLDNEIFENRYSLLSFCQKNRYQFNSLRHAKYSSMMILYHARTMTSLTMEAKGSIGCHVHKLVPCSQTDDCRTKSMKMQMKRASEIRAMLELLEHASHCRSSRSGSCSVSLCARVKNFFQHNQVCAVRVNGGCEKCKKIWFLMHLHSRKCEDVNCRFPRCADIKRHKEKVAAESEIRRRAASTS